ncbi:MAG: MFS transporter [Caulobacterales bacterium]
MYITFVIALVTVLSNADKNILSVLLVPIQQDLHVSDTAMGALTGIAFSLVYATIALPMARIADRGNRRNLISIAVAFWSVMTFVCGLATSYITLLLARIGVAAGEAAAAPSQSSMVGDLFSYKHRGAALGFITVGSLVGLSGGAFLAGWITEAHSWKVAFMVLGAPGLLVALLMFFTVPEPKRGVHETLSDADDPVSENWRTSMRYLLSVKSLRGLMIAQIFVGVSFTGYLTWLPAFLMRVHHMGTAEMSLWYGIAIGVGGALANVVGGIVSDRLARRGTRWRLYFMAVMMLAAAPIVVAALVATHLPTVITTMIIYSFAAGGATAVGGATLLELIRPKMRGVGVAVFLFCTSVVGGGGGPLLLGAISDYMKAEHGEEALRYSLMIVPVFLVLAAIGFFISSWRADADAAAAGRPDIATS